MIATHVLSAPVGRVAEPVRYLLVSRHLCFEHRGSLVGDATIVPHGEATRAAGPPPGTKPVPSTSVARHQEVCFSAQIVCFFSRTRGTLPCLRELKCTVHRLKRELRGDAAVRTVGCRQFNKVGTFKLHIRLADTASEQVAVSKGDDEMACAGWRRHELSCELSWPSLKADASTAGIF